MKIFGFAGYSGSGKTTLIEKLIPVLVRRGLKVSLLKHAHHDFDIDVPGKDSYRFRAAGAAEVLVKGAQRWALMHEVRNEPEDTFSELISRLSPCDLVLVEGWKGGEIPKIEVWRQATGKPRLDERGVLALATDVPVETRLPRFDQDDIENIATFVEKNSC